MSEAFEKIRTALSSGTFSAVMLAELGVENLATLLRKNSDYDGSGLSEPFLAPGVPAETALRVRMSDKIARIRALQRKGPEVAG